MDQYNDAMDKIDRLLRTKLDELIVSLIMLAISAAALFTGKIGEETWAVITGAVIAAWTGSNVYRQGQAAKGAASVASAALSAVIGNGGEPPADKPAP